jgi:predicted Zn-dependent peptidase
MGVSVSDLEAAIEEEISIVKNELVSPDEFQKLKNQVEDEFISKNASAQGRSEALANYYVYFKDANLVNTEIERYNKVTPDDLKRAANNYLTKENRVVLYYLPKSEQGQ